MSLEGLCWHSKSTDGQYDVNRLLEETSPSPSLQRLSLPQMDPMDKGPLVWLTYPHAGCTYMLKTMKIMMNFDLGQPSLFTVELANRTACETPLCRTSQHFSSPATLLKMASKLSCKECRLCTRLIFLFQCLDRFLLSLGPLLALPDSFRALRIHFDRGLKSSPGNQVHQAIIGLLDASPYIRRLSISYTDRE